MLDFLGVNFLAIIYNLWLLTTKIMIGDKKKISPQYSILYSSKFGHIWMLNPCTTSQFRRRIRNSWFLKGSVWFTVQFWWQAFVICIWVSFHSYIKLGRSQGGVYFWNIITLLCRNLKFFPNFRPRFTCPPMYQFIVWIHPMLTSTTYTWDHYSCLKNRYRI